MMSPWEGGDLSFQVLNGGGLQAANDQRQFDRDSQKNMALRFSQDVGPVRVGAFGYRGTEEADGVRNTISVYGPDATIPLGSIGEINAQYLRRTDRDPFYGSCTPIRPCPGGASLPFSTKVDALLAEVLVWPAGPAGRVYFTGAYNWIKADQPVVSLRLGEQQSGSGFLQEYQTVSGGAHYVYRRNLRLMAELGYDFELSQTRLIAGTVIAF